MFRIAKPIVVKETENVLNAFAEFAAETSSLSGAELHICAADFYRVTVNGQFVAHGPARTAKGYARMDRIPLDGFGTDGQQNRVVISVAGYQCRSMSTVQQRMFLWAEIVRDGEVLAATGRDFAGFLTGAKVRKTARYSVQRHFLEEWDLRSSLRARPVPVEVMEDPPQVIERIAPYPAYTDTALAAASSLGAFRHEPPEKIKTNAYSFQPDDYWGSYRDDEVKHSYIWVQEQKQLPDCGEAALPVEIPAGRYAIFQFQLMQTGFLQLSGTAEEGTEAVLAFSEHAAPDHFAFTDMNAQNVIDLTLGGAFDLLSFEPYTFRFAALFVRAGSVRLEGFGAKSYVGDVSDVLIPDEVTDPCLRKIYSGAVRTFAHNALDLYTDCPSRERAGWLCDSYFTGKVEYCLHGKTPVEDAFLENYRLYRNEGEYPAGILPMCYPSETQGRHTFIPQWTMWYILEVEDYINHRGHRDAREAFRKSIYALLAFYAQYENGDGLLESLPSWNFIEWSRANKWTQNVNYPTNFLYSEVLRCVSRLYGDSAAAEKAERVAEETIRQSFNGSLFLDHAVRENGTLKRCQDCSETGQYYAILFGGFDLMEPMYAELRHLVLDFFRADRTELLEEIVPVNAFIGAYLRLEVLLKMGENRRVLESLKDFFGGMVEKTGTLWELRQCRGSLDHGFAAYALVAMRKALGIDSGNL